MPSFGCAIMDDSACKPIENDGWLDARLDTATLRARRKLGTAKGD